MENVGQSVVNPMVKFLTEILDDISSGDLRVPNFQRPYVWRPADAIALFDSIYKGYPIGSVLFWETGETLISFNQIGPFLLNLEKQSELNYILDGHQRLSTLYGILKSKKNIEIVDPHRWVLYFDLDENEFFFKTTTSNVHNYIAMDKIINTIDFLEECKRIEQHNPTRADYYINKAQKLTQAIVTYKIAITQIKRGNLTSAVEIFSRLNTKGMDMTPDQMLSALSYKEGKDTFKLADKIDEILSSLNEFNFSEIERIFIFRAIIAAAKKDIYNVRLEDLAKDTKTDLVKIVEGCRLSIIKAAQFLTQIVKVPSEKFLPYNLQLVFLSEFFYRQSNPSNEQIDELTKWFWFTSYSGWFAGANSSKIKRGLDDIRGFAVNNRGSILSDKEYKTKTIEIPEKFDFRYARIKAYILFLNQLNPKPFNSLGDDSKNILAEYGTRALHNIVPTEINSFANKMILPPVRVGYAKSELIDLLIDDDILESHVITNDAIYYLNTGNYETFLNIRTKLILDLENRFISELGLNYSMPIHKSIHPNQFQLFEEG